MTCLCCLGKARVGDAVVRMVAVVNIQMPVVELQDIVGVVCIVFDGEPIKRLFGGKPVFLEVLQELLVVFVGKELLLRLAEMHGLVAGTQVPLAVFVPALQQVERIACGIGASEVVVQVVLLIDRNDSHEPRAVSSNSWAAPVALSESPDRDTTSR